MYARTATMRGNPAAVDEAIAFVRDEWLPRTTGLEGCTGLSMLVGRKSGRCIVTSGWATEEAMLASAVNMRDDRARLGQILGAVPVVNQWDIALMHKVQKAGPQACTRVVWSSRPDVAALDDDVATFRMTLLPQIEELTGFCSASLMIDREEGLAVGTVVFDDRAAIEATRADAEQIRERVAGELGADVVHVDEMEVAFAHLHVPEMA